MKITLLQTDIIWGQPEANLAHLDHLLEGVGECDLIVLPEMFTTGFDTNPETVADDEGLALKWMRNTVRQRNCALAGSVATKVGENYYNRMYFVSPDLLLASYDKHHLFTYGHEQEAFTPGHRRVVIPYRGAWLEYETDINDIFYVRIDKNRKLPVTSLIRALGVQTDAEIRELFGDDERILATIEKDTAAHNREEALIEIYKRLRPGEPPTVDSAQTMLHNLFFDPKRYDLSAVGRYKFNKKLALGTRITGHRLSRPVADPLTGEVIAEAGETLSRERAAQIEKLGVSEVWLEVEGREIKAFSNKMVWLHDFVDCDEKALGIHEHVSFPVLQRLMEQYEGEELLDAIRDNAADLIPNHVTVDDILASINYMCCLVHGVGTADDIDHLGNRRCCPVAGQTAGAQGRHTALMGQLRQGVGLIHEPSRWTRSAASKTAASPAATVPRSSRWIGTGWI